MTIYNTVYQITNNINGKIYVGVHVTENPYDNYMGSGDKIRLAIKKHGKENFTKEILFFAFTERDAYFVESIIVDIKFVESSYTYNVNIGGSKPPGFKKGHTPHHKGKKLPKERCEKMSIYRKGTKWIKNPETQHEMQVKINEVQYYKNKGYVEGRLWKATIESKQVMSKARQGKDNPAYGKHRLDLVERNKIPFRWMNNREINKRVFLHEVEEYQSKGFNFGRK